MSPAAKDQFTLRSCGGLTQAGVMSSSNDTKTATGIGKYAVKVRKKLKRESHRFAGTALGRERRYVRRGIRAYQHSIASGSDLYLLRRNVHRIEKGLTMRPARQQFATDYILETTNAFQHATASGLCKVDDAEFRWMHSVLAAYFSATTASQHPAIAQSREIFADTTKALVLTGAQSGPHLANAPVPSVKIEDLEALAVGRRSVRWFTSEPVSREIVDRAIRIAAESPTACNRQPYRFEIFDDPASTAKVAAIPMGTGGYGHQITGLIVVIGNLAAFFDQRDRHLIYIDGCLAAMGLVYGLESQGVSSCCINWPDVPDREAAMRKLLDLKPYERVVMLIAYGYADPDALVPFSAKRLIEEIRTFRSLS